MPSGELGRPIIMTFSQQDEKQNMALGITNRRQISVLQAKHSSFAHSSAASRSAFHIDYDDQLYTSVGHPTVHCNSLVERVEKSKVMTNCLGGYTSFEDVQARVQHE